MSVEELVAGPLELWLAPRGESFPMISEDPSGSWELLGNSGDKNYTDDGVTVTLGQSIEAFTGAGSTMKRKAWRTEESMEVGVTVADTRAEIWRRALNDNSTTESTGQVSLPLLRGHDVHEYALLARGKSPYEESGDDVVQFQVPACYMMSEPEVSHVKGEPAGVEFTFDALEPTSTEETDFVVIFSDATIS